MNKYSALISMIALSAGAAFGQMPPGIPECKGPDAINYIKIKDSERQFYFENTTITNDYLLVGLSSRYLKLAEELMRFPQAVAISNSKKTDSIRKTHLIQESKNRQSSIFSIDEKEAILTQWNLKNDGAKICIPNEFINASFDGSEGVLAVIVAVPATTDCMWKFSWATDEKSINNEFYLKDTCLAGKPKMTKNMVFDIMRRVVLHEKTFPP